jgi:PIN domain nuclease of toxin-antitoxin system
MILLDTHVILWIEADPPRLSDAARAAIGDPRNTVHVSSISAFEIALKVRRGLLELPAPVDIWFEEICRLRGFCQVAVDARIAATSALLPEIHRDPCDRLLVATARLHTLRLVTADRLIPDYPGVDVIW